MNKEEPMRGADECLCTDSVVLKCEAVVLVGHCFLVKTGIRANQVLNSSVVKGKIQL